MRAITTAVAVLLAGCSASTGTSAPPALSPVISNAPSPLISAAPARSGPVVIRYRVVRRATDAATADFTATVVATLQDPRGWQRGDVRLVLDQSAPYAVVLVEADEAQRLCRPYDVYRKYSCQNGATVVINAERWRHGTKEWTGSLSAYRQMLVNHEFGHLLGLHHPPGPACPAVGRMAPVMAQQSTELNGCRPNPWPLAAEVARLARHDLPLAPPASS